MAKKYFLTLLLLMTTTVVHAGYFDQAVQEIICEERENCQFLGEFDAKSTELIDNVIRICRILTPREKELINTLCEESSEVDLEEEHYSFLCHLYH